MFRTQKGFTLIELIMVIVILGLLAVVAIPRYYDLQDNARASAEQGVVGGVRAGIYTFHANAVANGDTPVWPATLDSNGDATCATCFSNVLAQGGINDANWSKSGTTYTGPNGGSYTYTNTTGEFV